MFPIVGSHLLLGSTSQVLVPQLMFISFHVSRFLECYPATVLSNRREEKPTRDQKGGEEVKGATSQSSQQDEDHHIK